LYICSSVPGQIYSASGQRPAQPLLDPHCRAFVDFGNYRAHPSALVFGLKLADRPEIRQEEDTAARVFREGDRNVLLRNLLRNLERLKTFEIREEYVSLAVHVSCLRSDERRSLHLNRRAEAERLYDAGVEFLPERLETLPCRIAASGSL